MSEELTYTLSYSGQEADQRLGRDNTSSFINNGEGNLKPDGETPDKFATENYVDTKETALDTKIANALDSAIGYTDEEIARIEEEIPSNTSDLTNDGEGTGSKFATEAYVDEEIAAIPTPMQFKGTVGTGGTITTLPTASAENNGFVYKVITEFILSEETFKVGDTAVSNGSAWIRIPSGDEPSGTVTNVATGTGLTGGPITTSGTISVDTTVIATKSELDTKSTVSVSDTGTATDEVKYITIDGVEKKLAGGSELPEVINNRYLHTNTLTGELEWSEVSTNKKPLYKYQTTAPAADNVIWVSKPGSTAWITWDGDTDGKEIVYVYGVPFVKIADYTDDYDDLIKNASIHTLFKAPSGTTHSYNMIGVNKEDSAARITAYEDDTFRLALFNPPFAKEAALPDGYYSEYDGLFIGIVPIDEEASETYSCSPGIYWWIYPTDVVYLEVSIVPESGREFVLDSNYGTETATIWDILTLTKVSDNYIPSSLIEEYALYLEVPGEAEIAYPINSYWVEPMPDSNSYFLEEASGFYLAAVIQNDYEWEHEGQVALFHKGVYLLNKLYYDPIYTKLFKLADLGKTVGGDPAFNLRNEDGTYSQIAEKRDLDTKSTVSVNATGTATDEVQYITIDGVEKKLAGGNTITYSFNEPTETNTIWAQTIFEPHLVGDNVFIEGAYNYTQTGKIVNIE